jgi:hypothetical protein
MAQNSRSSRFEAVNPDKIDPDRSANLVPGQLTDNQGATPGGYAERRHAVNRRGSVFRAFLYGNFHPRRRFSQRAADEHHFLFDWHEPRILYLALGVLLLSCTDALFTLNLLNAGATEANTVMASILDQGVDRFVFVKIGITAISVVILVTTARRKFFGLFSVEHLLRVFCTVYILVICYEVYLFRFVFELDIIPGYLIPW